MNSSEYCQPLEAALSIAISLKWAESMILLLATMQQILRCDVWPTLLVLSNHGQQFQRMPCTWDWYVYKCTASQRLCLLLYIALLLTIRLVVLESGLGLESNSSPVLVDLDLDLHEKTKPSIKSIRKQTVMHYFIFKWWSDVPSFGNEYHWVVLAKNTDSRTLLSSVK